MKHLLILLLVPVLFASCKEEAKPRIDLFKLHLDEKVRTLVDYDHKILDFGGCNIKQYINELYPVRSHAFNDSQ